MRTIANCFIDFLKSASEVEAEEFYREEMLMHVSSFCNTEKVFNGFTSVYLFPDLSIAKINEDLNFLSQNYAYDDIFDEVNILRKILPSKEFLVASLQEKELALTEKQKQWYFFLEMLKENNIISEDCYLAICEMICNFNTIEAELEKVAEELIAIQADQVM